jgi:hypothetical protein
MDIKQMAKSEKCQKGIVVRRLTVGPMGQFRNPPGIRTRNLLIAQFALLSLEVFIFILTVKVQERQVEDRRKS